jgi:hypothetical protein
VYYFAEIVKEEKKEPLLVLLVFEGLYTLYTRKLLSDARGDDVFDFKDREFGYIKRPGVDAFLDKMVERYDVALWTSTDSEHVQVSS